MNFYNMSIIVDLDDNNNNNPQVSEKIYDKWKNKYIITSYIRFKLYIIIIEYGSINSPNIIVLLYNKKVRLIYQIYWLYSFCTFNNYRVKFKISMYLLWNTKIACAVAI